MSDLSSERPGHRSSKPNELGCESFDELRLPSQLALRVTFDVIYPADPAQSRVLAKPGRDRLKRSGSDSERRRSFRLAPA